MRGLAFTNNGSLVSSTIDIVNLSTDLLTATGASNQIANVGLANTAVTAGTYSALVVDAKGRAQTGLNMVASGDASGTASGNAITLTLASVGTAGTYSRVVTDAKGRVISGSNVGTITFTTGTIPVTSTTGTITPANTTPVTTTAGTLWVQAVTPSSTTTRIIINFSVFVDTSINGSALGGGAIITVAVFRGSTYVGTSASRVLTQNSPMNISFSGVDVPGTISSVTYTAYIGGSAAGTIYINQTTSANYGGTVGSAYVLHDTGT